MVVLQPMNPIEIDTFSCLCYNRILCNFWGVFRGLLWVGRWLIRFWYCDTHKQKLQQQTQQQRPVDLSNNQTVIKITIYNIEKLSLVDTQQSQLLVAIQPVKFLLDNGGHQNIKAINTEKRMDGTAKNTCHLLFILLLNFGCSTVVVGDELVVWEVCWPCLDGMVVPRRSSNNCS